ncbi:glycosyltransferase family 9 protein [Burkholderia multivorans]|nr:glycosyltransferase family 9 protein [Burkholderia multivorans]
MPVPAPMPAPRRIAVFRALQLGDMLCAVPALRALRRAWPQAHITLIGLGEGGEFRRRFGHYIDDWMAFPGLEAFPEQPADESALPAFYALARARRFDLALQMHGSGLQSNGVVAQLGARRWAGFVPGGAARREAGRVPWPDDLPEPMRYLALLDEGLGLPARDAALEFPLTPADHAEARALCEAHGLQAARTVLVHPGARLRSRRWPAQRFGAVAAALARQGWQVAVTGTPDESAIVRAAIEASGGVARDLCGRTSLGGLAALVSRCRLVVCNDTGMSHVCAAVGTRSVVVASGSDVQRWAPLDRIRHPVLWTDVPCRPCSHEQCPIGHPCALGVTVPDVLARATDHLRRDIP